MSEKVKETKERNELLCMLRGVLISVAATLIMVLLFALIVKLTEMGETAIKPVNQIIKLIGIFLGCWFGIKDKSKGWLRGLILGLIITVVSYLIFSIIAQKFTFNWMLLTDLAFGMIAGAICGIITVNLRKFN